MTVPTAWATRPCTATGSMPSNRSAATFASLLQRLADSTQLRLKGSVHEPRGRLDLATSRRNRWILLDLDRDRTFKQPEQRGTFRLHPHQIVGVHTDTDEARFSDSRHGIARLGDHQLAVLIHVIPHDLRRNCQGQRCNLLAGLYNDSRTSSLELTDHGRQQCPLPVISSPCTGARSTLSLGKAALVGASFRRLQGRAFCSAWTGFLPTLTLL